MARSWVLPVAILTAAVAAAACSSETTGDDDDTSSSGSSSGGQHGPCYTDYNSQACADCLTPAQGACESGPCAQEANLHYDCMALALQDGCYDANGNPLPLDPSECCADLGEIKIQCFFANCPDFVACY